MWKAHEKNCDIFGGFVMPIVRVAFLCEYVYLYKKILQMMKGKNVKGKNVKGTRTELWYIWFFCHAHCKSSFSKIFKRIKGKNVKSTRSAEVVRTYNDRTKFKN